MDSQLWQLIKEGNQRSHGIYYIESGFAIEWLGTVGKEHVLKMLPPDKTVFLNSLGTLLCEKGICVLQTTDILMHSLNLFFGVAIF